MDKGMNFQWYSTYVNNLLQVHVHEMKNEEMNEFIYVLLSVSEFISKMITTVYRFGFLLRMAQ